MRICSSASSCEIAETRSTYSSRERPAMSTKKARLGGASGNRGEIVRKAWMIAARPGPAKPASNAMSRNFSKPRPMSISVRWVPYFARSVSMIPSAVRIAAALVSAAGGCSWSGVRNASAAAGSRCRKVIT
jgi:hypothetical protein